MGLPRFPARLIFCLQDKLLEAFMWVSQSSEDGEMIPRSSQHIETRFRPRPDPDFVSWAELDLCGEICHWSPQSLPVDDSALPHLAGPATPSLLSVQPKIAYAAELHAV